MGKVNKIFGIGLSKTATTSLSAALNILGYRCFDFPHFIMINSSCKVYYRHKINKKLWFNFFKDLTKNTDNRLILNTERIEEFDAFTDTPVVRFYKQLDKLYPDSKFILTTREIENWLRSCRSFFCTGRANGNF